MRRLAAPAAEPIALWWADLDGPLLQAEACLSAAEQARAARFVHERHRRRYTAAHVGLRTLLGEYLGRAPGELDFIDGPFGKPGLATAMPTSAPTSAPIHTSAGMNLPTSREGGTPLPTHAPSQSGRYARRDAHPDARPHAPSGPEPRRHPHPHRHPHRHPHPHSHAPAPLTCAFNMSHCEHLAVYALAPDGNIGVDVELLRPMADAQALARHHFTPAEQRELAAAGPAGETLRFLFGWTRKEACLKAIGCGLAVEPHSFEVGLSPGSREVVVSGPDGRVMVDVESLVDGQRAVISWARVRPGHHFS